ncbi:TIR domain-containing protein [Actimicrobium sp. CCI2.3]|uniref:TIR domain-containing protein n=1 Tax=Actimicrobium sp. CCI2.3 TaxID=3048616 RepID=UPI002AB526B9|nr:TIR domain-containing protein [Actimicrobium sp. CCI2.3]MDY7576190.1 TIR domain-containing protein [Actimicrobium sp. CCI2.3]MEB0020605.1 TIR domain-containing protein [Actimicrobium sp. CCI2.3]
MARKKVFVSFDFDNDATIKMLLVNQSKLDDTPFDIWDSSVKKHMEGDWQDKVKVKLRNVDIVCVLCGEKTHTASGVAIELQIAKELGKPYFLLKGYKERNCKKPTSATSTDKIYSWTWENLKALIHGGR